MTGLISSARDSIATSAVTPAYIDKSYQSQVSLSGFSAFVKPDVWNIAVTGFSLYGVT